MSSHPGSAEGGLPPSPSYVQEPAPLGPRVHRCSAPLRGPGTHCRVRRGSHPPGPSPGLPLLNPLHWERAPDRGWQKPNCTAASGGRAAAGGRGAGRALLNPEPPLREGEACPLHGCPDTPAGPVRLRSEEAGVARGYKHRPSGPRPGPEPGRTAGQHCPTDGPPWCW